jgi:hypothetical protein
VKIIDALNNNWGGDALQQMQVYYWIKEVKSGRKDLSNVPPPGVRQMRDWMTALRRSQRRSSSFNEKNWKGLEH